MRPRLILPSAREAFLLSAEHSINCFQIRNDAALLRENMAQPGLAQAQAPPGLPQALPGLEPGLEAYGPDVAYGPGSARPASSQGSTQAPFTSQGPYIDVQQRLENLHAATDVGWRDLGEAFIAAHNRLAIMNLDEIIGSVNHPVFGFNDDYDIVKVNNTQRRVPLWNLWYYAVKAIYANPLLGYGDDWIEITTGYTRTREQALAEYDRVRAGCGTFKHIMVQMQEATFSYESSYEGTDCC